MVVASRIDQMAENLLLRPAAGGASRRSLLFGDRGQPRRRGIHCFAQSHFNTTLASPVLLALSAARTTSRCSPGASPARSRTKRSRMESITPSEVSIGTQLEASSEYSQRRSGEAE